MGGKLARRPGVIYNWAMIQSLPTPKRWTRDEWYRLAELGFFPEGCHTELIEGEILVMSPQGPNHSRSMMLGTEILTDFFRGTHMVRVQCPLTIDERTEPEPDFSIIGREEALALRGKHPGTAELVIEISDSSLSYDRNEKASLYARAGVPEYGILNLQKRSLELHRQPHQDSELRFGWGYASRTILGPEDDFAPLAGADRKLRVGDFF